MNLHLGIGISLLNLLDIALVAVLVWIGISWFSRSRARFALLGVAMLGVVYLAARRLDLQLSAFLLQGFFAVFVIFVVVVFQEDLRRLFEQIAMLGLRRRRELLEDPALDTIARAAGRMAEDRIGALLVLPGREPLERHLEGGALLDARISEPLLLSLFDSSTPGHDGAVVIDQGRATRFMVHLPLSNDREQLGPGGTRHAAALGLAERTDALAVVVSEERGTISVAHDGRLRILAGAEALAEELRSFVRTTTGVADAAGRMQSLRQNLPRATASIAIAAVLWFVLIPGGEEAEKSVQATVKIENLPKGYVLESVEPAYVEVILSGSQRDLMLVDDHDIVVRVDAFLAKLGRRTFAVSVEQIRHPRSVQVLAVEPERVRVSLQQAESG